MQADKTRVVICGGGAGGVELAVQLASRRNIEVHLVDPSPSHIWKPLLHEIASGTLDVASHEVSYLALAERRGFVFAQGRLKAINRDTRRILVAATRNRDGQEIIPEREIAYGVLVLSIGGVTADFGISGVSAHTLFLDSVADAERIFDRILQACMSANYWTGLARPESYRVCIVGGGATGVELAAELRSSARALSAYGLHDIEPDTYLSLTVINADARLVQQLPERVSTSVEMTLRTLGVDVRNASAVIEVEPTAIVLKSGERIASDLTIWVAGVRAPPILSELGGLTTNRGGQVVVTASLQSVTDPLIFALGDCASAPWIGTESRVPPRAQAAHQQAKFLARAIPVYLRGREPGQFRYNDLGSLLSLGNHHAVGRLMGFIRGAGLEVEGIIARLLYRWLYKRHLAALFGWGAVLLDTLGNWMRRATRPRVKLH
jgi:NADH dehydrogenase